MGTSVALVRPHGCRQRNQALYIRTRLHALGSVREAIRLGRNPYLPCPLQYRENYVLVATASAHCRGAIAMPRQFRGMVRYDLGIFLDLCC